MHHYEKENAKEWQMDLGNTPRQSSAPNHKADVESDGDGWTQVVSSRPVPPRRFEASSSKAPTTDARIPNPSAYKPHLAKVNGVPTRGSPNQPATAANPPTANAKDLSGKGPHPTAIPPHPLPKRPIVAPDIIPCQGPAKARYPTGVKLVRKEDNAAKGAFRRAKPHDALFTLNKTCEKIEPDRTKMYNRLEEIGVRFNSFIRPPQFLADRILLLWGDEEQTAQTIAELNEWVKSSDDDDDSFHGPREKMQLKLKNEKFARIGYNQNKKAEQLDKKIREEARMHKFQKNPEDGQEFAFQGCFLWPVDEVRPEELLGPSCEAFDPIRTYNHSHIIFEATLSGFKILSNKEAAVQNALQRIEGTMREFVARSGKIYSSHMVQLPRASNMLKEVKVLPGSTGKVPVLTGASLISQEVHKYIQQKDAIESENRKRMRHALCRVIERLPLYRGQVRMRVLFGTMTLSMFRWPEGATTVPFSDFIRNIDVTSTKGALIRDLQCKLKAEELFARCSTADGLFESLSTMYDYDPPKELQPVYTARFTFQPSDTGNAMLEVEFTKPSGGQGIYEITRLQWTKEDQTEGSIPLELNMMQLNGGLSWKLQVKSENVVDDSRITPHMADFASSVAFKPPPSGIRPEITGYKVFTFAPNLRLQSFEQKTAVRYCHKKHGNWIFEIARYDTFTGNIVTASGKTQWGASYWNAEWDNTLGANLSLGIGQAAKWNPWLSTFFPENSHTPNKGRHTGFQDFMQDVKYITGMLDEMKGMANDHVVDEGDLIDAIFS